MANAKDEQAVKQAEERRKEDSGKPDSEIGFGGTWFTDMGAKDAKGVGKGK